MFLNSPSIVHKTQLKKERDDNNALGVKSSSTDREGLGTATGELEKFYYAGKRLSVDTSAGIKQGLGASRCSLKLIGMDISASNSSAASTGIAIANTSADAMVMC